MNRNEPLLFNAFIINGKSHSVRLFHHQLTWCPTKSGEDDMSEWMSLKVQDIFCTEIEDRGQQRETSCCLPRTDTSLSQNIVVYYAQRNKLSEAWECAAVKLGHLDSTLLETWRSSLQSLLDELNYRPKNILIFLNPFGGKRRAKDVFENSVKPILELAKIAWTVIETKYQNHATETLMTMGQERLIGLDVVVAVGGDGTVCEIITGFLKRRSEPITVLQSSSVKIAVIPAGSSNALAYSVHGTDDPCTAAIHLVLGTSIPLDVGAIQDNHSGAAKFFVTQVSYGHLADTLEKSDKLRWMGPVRYNYAGLCKFLNHKTYEGTLEMRLATDESRKPLCECKGYECPECFSAKQITSKDKLDGGWKTVEGRFIGISAANVSCRCALSPQGLAPYAHLSDGHMDVIVIRKASRADYLRYLLRTAGDSRTAFQLPFVERYHVKELNFTPISCCNLTTSHDDGLGSQGSSTSVTACGCDPRNQKKKHSSWNCDGELLEQPNVRVTVHSDLIRVMARAPLKDGPSFPYAISDPPSISRNFDPLPTEIPIN